MYQRIAALLFILFVSVGLSSLQIGARSNRLPDCTLIAQDAWNFNEREISGFIEFFENKGTGTVTMLCRGDTNNPRCPIFLPQGGPDGDGSVYIWSLSSGIFLSTGLTAVDQIEMDYNTDNKLSLSFHFKSHGLASYGWFVTPVVIKFGEYFSGADNSGTHSDRICMDIALVNDLGGPAEGGIDCGATAPGTNNGLGATTGAGSMPQNIWQHVALVFEGEAPPDSGADDGTYKVYLDGALVHIETGIDGIIPNGGNKWKIGVPANTFRRANYEIDNLQIFKLALSASDVLELDCNVPNQQQFP